MDVTSYKQFQDNLDATFKQVCNGHTPVLVEQENGGGVVLIAQEDYASMLAVRLLRDASESVLKQIWDNDDDAEYDRL